MSKVLFIIDKIEFKYFEFNNLVTNFWIITEFLDRGEQVYITTIPMLALKGKIAVTKCYKTFVQNQNIYYDNKQEEYEIDNFDLVMFRPDHPVYIDYINFKYIFDFVSTKVINSPKSIIYFNEKLHSIYFSEYMTKTLVTS